MLGGDRRSGIARLLAAGLIAKNLPNSTKPGTLLGETVLL
jgi:hypothetical protein